MKNFFVLIVLNLLNQTLLPRIRPVLSKNASIGAISALCWSADGKVLLSGSTDGIISVWQSESMILKKSWLAHFGPVASLAWCGVDLAIYSDCYKHLRFDSCEPFAKEKIVSCSSVLPSSIICGSGQTPPRLASGTIDGQVKIHSYAPTQSTECFQGLSNFVLAIGQARNADIFSAASADGQIMVWDGQSSNQIARLSALPNFVRTVAPSPDGRFLAYGDGFSVVIVRLADLATIARFSGHKGFVTALDWAPDGKLLASGGVDGVINIWPLEAF